MDCIRDWPSCWAWWAVGWRGGECGGRVASSVDGWPGGRGRREARWTGGRVGVAAVHRSPARPALSNCEV